MLALFKVTEGKKKSVVVAGSRVTKGLFKKDAFYRVIRGENVIFDGEFYLLRRINEFL